MGNLLVLGKKISEVDTENLTGIDYEGFHDPLYMAETIEEWSKEETRPTFRIFILNKCADKIIGFSIDFSGTVPELVKALNEKNEVFREWFKTDPEIFLSGMQL